VLVENVNAILIVNGNTVDQHNVVMAKERESIPIGEEIRETSTVPRTRVHLEK
jgi:hypothetical protein